MNTLQSVLRRVILVKDYVVFMLVVIYSLGVVLVLLVALRIDALVRYYLRRRKTSR